MMPSPAPKRCPRCSRAIIGAGGFLLSAIRAGASDEERKEIAMSEREAECTFCNSQAPILQDDLAFVIYDKYPISPGHVRIHLIPRFRGDVENPRAGVRGVIPARQY
jgi:hypothetical protein